MKMFASLYKLVQMYSILIKKNVFKGQNNIR